MCQSIIIPLGYAVWSLFQLFGLEQTVEDAEVLFADHFQAAVEKVHSHDSKLAKHLAHEQESKCGFAVLI